MSTQRRRRRRRRFDTVEIVFRRVLIGGRRFRIITAVFVRGSARPCRSLLMVGDRVGPAVRCLLNNGFRLIFRGTNTLIFRRRR
ncbi:MAG: hypothetical protein ACM32O_19000 [Clostridia bacterium]